MKEARWMNALYDGCDDLYDGLNSQFRSGSRSRDEHLDLPAGYTKASNAELVAATLGHLDQLSISKISGINGLGKISDALGKLTGLSLSESMGRVQQSFQRH